MSLDEPLGAWIGFEILTFFFADFCWCFFFFKAVSFGFLRFPSVSFGFLRFHLRSSVAWAC